MHWLDDVFSNPNTPWVIAGVLVLISIIEGLFWRYKVTKIRFAVTKIRAVLGIPQVLKIPKEIDRWNYFTVECFEESKEKLHPLATQEPFVRQTLRYLNSCALVEDQPSNKLRLETTVSPAEVIQLSEHLLEHNVQVSFYRSFPNYLVGAGLCITFLGLALVIGKASSVLTQAAAVENINSKPTGNESHVDSDTTLSNGSNKALSDLLVAASSKFWSSLTAVLCSIFYGIWFRKLNQEMERIVALYIRDLGYCARFISTDEIHYESLQLLRKCEGYQAVTTNGIGLLKSGLDNTQSSSAEQHRILLEKLEAVANGLAQKFGELGNDIGREIGGGVGKEVTKEMRDAAGHMQNITKEFKDLTDKVKQQSESIATNFSVASGSAKDIQIHFKELPALADPLKQASLLLHRGAELVGSNIGKIMKENENVAARWETLADLVTEVDEALGKEIQSLDNIFPPYADNLKKFSEEWQSAMVSALGGLAANIKELSGSHEELRTQRTVWHDSAAAVARSVDAVNEHVSRFTEALAAHGAAKMLELQSAATTNDPLPQDTQDSVSDAEKTSDAETISTTTPA